LLLQSRQAHRLSHDEEAKTERTKLADNEAKGDFSHLMNKKGELITKPLPQPTLPKVSVDDDDDTSSVATRVQPSNASNYSYTKDFYHVDKSMDYPPMPAYNPNSHHPAPGTPTYFSQDPSPRPYESADSFATLVPSSFSFARDPVDRQGSPYYTPSIQSNKIDPVNVYQGRVPLSPAPSQTRHAMAPPTEHERQASSGSSVGLPYDEYTTDYRTQPTQNGRYVNSSRGYDMESGRGNYQGSYAT